MASFVAEILTSAGQMETQEASAKLKQLTEKTDGLKMQLREMTVHKYENFMSKMYSTEQLVNDVEHIKADMDEVANKIEHQIKGQLNISTGEFQSLTSQLEDVNSLVVVLEKLVQLQDGLQAIETSTGQKKYSKAVDAVLMVKSILHKEVHGQEDQMQILKAIRAEIVFKREKLIRDMLEGFGDLIHWEIPEDQKNVQASSQTYELHLLMRDEGSSQLDQVLIGLEKMGILNEEMRKFFDNLMKYVITPGMSGRCVLSEKEMNRRRILTITSQVGDVDTHPTPTDLYANLETVQRFLTTNLLDIVVRQNTDDNSSPVTLLSYFREMVGDRILSMAVKECLIPSIPSSNKELTEFSNILTITTGFHNLWLKMGLISNDCTALPDFVENVNTLFANKKCREILERVRKLMTTEIHNTVDVSHDKPLGDLPRLIDGNQEGKKARKDILNVQSPLSSHTFRLPACKISSSILEVMVIAYETLHEAASCSQQGAIQMFCVVRDIFELFCSVFPTYHKQSLETLPQFTALHYNNCMYISHHLMTLGHQFSKRMPQNVNMTFIDLVQKIRRLGSESFLRQVIKQREQMLECLGAANGFLNVSQKDEFSTAERAIKQTVYQLLHLKKVWQEVLPPKNYRKSLGGLVNGLVEQMVDSIVALVKPHAIKILVHIEDSVQNTCGLVNGLVEQMVDSIVALEDMSEDDTKALSKLLNTISDRAPELFEIDGDTETSGAVEVERNVAKWQRFKELDMILSASMIDIVDRWAAGKGPLAVAFSANEVKQLIRALFQNTDRRATVLAKIK